MPGDVNLWPKLTGGEVIDLLGRLRGGLDRAGATQLLERFELDPTKKARTYSKGNRQKVALVAALASDAELLILDEPTSGLDPLMEAVFQDVHQRASRREGRTVLLSSHILAEVEALCDRVSIIRAGRTVQSGTLTELRHLTRTTITPRPTRPADAVWDARGRARRTVEGTRSPSTSTPITSTPRSRCWPGRACAAWRAHPPTLEELFLRQYGDEIARLKGRGDGSSGDDGSPRDGGRGRAAPRGRGAAMTGTWTLVRSRPAAGPAAPDALGGGHGRRSCWPPAASAQGLHPTQADLGAAAAGPLYDNASGHRAQRPRRTASARVGGQTVFQVEQSSATSAVVGSMGMLLVGRLTRGRRGGERAHRAGAGRGLWPDTRPRRRP